MGLYQLTDIQKAAGSKIKTPDAVGFNDKGQVAGNEYPPNSGFSYDPQAGVHGVGAAQGLTAFRDLIAIGNDGTIIGATGANAVETGFTYKLGAAAATSLAPLLEPHGLVVNEPHDINAAGDIVGWGEKAGGGGSIGWLLKGGNHFVNLTKTVDGKIRSADYINDHGFICGLYGDPDGQPLTEWTSFVYNQTTGHLKAFHLPHRAQLTRANKKNEVAGCQFIEGFPHGSFTGNFVYHDGTTTPLPEGPTPVALDDKGLVLGVDASGFGQLLDRTDSPPQWQNINFFIVGAPYYSVGLPIAINASGQILCDAKMVNDNGQVEERAVILTPGVEFVWAGKPSLNLGAILAHLAGKLGAGETSEERLTRIAAEGLAALFGSSERNPDVRHLAAQLVAGTVASRGPGTGPNTTKGRGGRLLRRPERAGDVG
jgi:hypothetical protein